jgi:hypothetical protein
MGVWQAFRDTMGWRKVPYYKQGMEFSNKSSLKKMIIGGSPRS